jgi:hypothetical protein
MVFVPLMFAFAVVGFCLLGESKFDDFMFFLMKFLVTLAFMGLIAGTMFAVVYIPFYFGLTGGSAMLCMMVSLAVIAAFVIALVVE